jgi:hypothetical protein
MTHNQITNKYHNYDMSYDTILRAIKEEGIKWKGLVTLSNWENKLQLCDSKETAT